MTTAATYNRTVTVDLPDYASQTITFRLKSSVAIALTASEIFPGKAYTLTLDANGVGSTALPCPDNTGDAAWLWQIELPDKESPQFSLAYNAASVSLATLIATAAEEVTPSLLDNYLLLTGGTLGGQLDFAGTDHAGIKLLSLTTAERDDLTPAEGMVIYNETTSQVQVYQGGAWVSVGEASAPALNDLTNVTITTPADKELLAFDNGSSDWINQTPAEAGLEEAGAAATVQGNLNTHASDTSNPHEVTAAQAGADVTGAAAAVQDNLDTHTADTANPHSVTAAQADALPENAGLVSVTETHTLLAGNVGKTHEASGTFTITCPDDLDAGYQVAIVNVGTGVITIAATTTLQSKAAAVTIATQYAMAVVYHRGSNVWLLAGDLE